MNGIRPIAQMISPNSRDYSFFQRLEGSQAGSFLPVNEFSNSSKRKVTPVLHAAKRQRVQELTDEIELSTYTNKRVNKTDKGWTTITNLRGQFSGKILLNATWNNADINGFNKLAKNTFNPKDPKKSKEIFISDKVKIKVVKALVNNEEKFAVVKKRYANKIPGNDFFSACKKEAKMQILAGEVAPKIYCLAERLDHENYFKSYMAMEFNGDVELAECIKHLELKTKARIALEAAIKLEKLHSLGVYHGDVKVTNLVLDQELSVKYIDFDCAESIGNGNAVKIQFIPDTVRIYHAPEIYLAAINSMNYASENFDESCKIDAEFSIAHDELLLPKKADIYSLATVIAALLNQDEELLLFAENYDDLEHINQSQHIVASLRVDETIKPLISNMLASEPQNRPELGEIIAGLQTYYESFKANDL